MIRQSGDQTALVRLQMRIARCADRLARTDRAKAARSSLDKTVEIWLQAEGAILEKQAG